MVLHEVNENANWVRMHWKCAFLMQWPNILFVTKAILGTFKDPEIMIGDKGAPGQRVNLADKPEERSMLVLKGYSNNFKGKISVTFNTKTNDVVITIPNTIPTDYKSLAMSVGPFMDSLELRMYAAK